MKAPRPRLAAICSGVPCSATPQFSEKPLLELHRRDVGVILTYENPLRAATRRFMAWLRTLPSIDSAGKAFLYTFL
jgi:hypothetical protein